MQARNEWSRRSVLRAGMLGLGAAAAGPLVAACSSSSQTAASTTAPTTTKAGGGTEALLEGAKADGKLNLIAISDDPGSYYRYVLEGFREYSGIDPNLTIPAAGSGIELDAAEKKGDPDQPDVVDIGASHAITATEKGLLASFLPEEWSDIPSAAKDPDGHWIATYYGLIGVISNPALLKGADPPGTLDDLRALPDGVQMAFSGDPRSAAAAGERAALSSAEALAAVWTVALAEGGSLDDIGPGIDFFAELAEADVLDPSALGIPDTMANGSTAVTMLNNFEFARADQTLRDESGGEGLQMRFLPSDQLFPNYAVQAVVADSPNPDAARLWLSYLVSDEGAKGFLRGEALPVRLPALLESGEVDEADLGILADLGITTEKLAVVDFPLPAQIVAAQKEVDERWGPDVMGE